MQPSFECRRDLDLGWDRAPRDSHNLSSIIRRVVFLNAQCGSKGYFEELARDLL